ncbi:glycoside hydrolase family 3 C-terminal domain-containing protein [Kitasatospora sp. NPDC058965]|uniref:glycoside hydrolase family 3 C-terminal domain-containing protein n=1 Tax=Kitasatospora sp. NPDC058965 TaxID=3346682 RepID=UPI0036A593DF
MAVVLAALSSSLLAGAAGAAPASSTSSTSSTSSASSTSAVSSASSAAAASTACPWVGSSAPIPQRVGAVLARMTLDQKVQLMTGANGSSGYAGFTPAIGSLCIPAMNLSDGPAGVGQGNGNVTQLPAPVDVAATWDTGAEQAYGQVNGAEHAAKGATVDLGPTINIVRDPRWGRAFESVGEDPYLNGQMGAATIRGVQSTGVLAQVKHIAAYNQETNRNTAADDVIVGDQALQEVYLPAFQAAVQQAAPSSAMCSYAMINGTWACESKAILNDALRQQFGFAGFVTSDWGATHSTVASVDAGLDQDMPAGDPYYGGVLTGAVNANQVAQSTVDTSVSRILTEMFAFGLFDKPVTGSTAQVATGGADQATGERIAEEGTVLLKNAGGVLPLGSSTTSVAVIGQDASTRARTSGGGSADVNSSGTVTPLQGIQAAAPAGTTVAYDAGSSTSSAAALAARSSVAVVFAGTGESEGSDLPGIDLSSADNALIAAVAAANPNTVVVLNNGSAVTMPWLGSVKGVLEAWYPGQSDGTAIANLLFGHTNPSGHLPVTFPTDLSQVPANTQAQWPGVNNQVQYSEGVDVGYRWYDSKGLKPLFPFGFGLSYTTFSFSNVTVGQLPQGGAATVTATVTNTGARAGADVAQLYVTDPAAAGQPPRRLQGFARVNLQPGQSQTVSFPLTEQNLHHWNTATGSWATSTGAYTIAVGDADSADALKATATLTVSANQLGRPVTLTNPGAQEGLAGTAVSLTAAATDATAGQTPAFTATGLPAGIALSTAGRFTGTPTTPGTYTVDLTAEDANGAQATTAFTWTVVPSSAGLPTTPLVGYQGLCLDVAGANNTDGTAVQVYTCNGTDAQQWTEESDGTVRTLGKCLDASGAGTANGTKVDLAGCTGSGAQTWQPQSGGTLLNPASGRCLDDTASGLSGTQVQLWDCSAAANQLWHPPTGSTPTRTGPVTGYASLCLDVRSAGSADRTPVQVYTCNGTNAQQWTVDPAANTLRALGKCLDVNGAGSANGTLVQLYTCNGTGAQTWQPQSGGALLNPASGRCLDDTGSGGAGTQLEIWDCTGGANQKWTLP